MDVNNDTTFNELDIEEFLARFLDPATSQPLQAGTPDWSRYDLNGDGTTGGSATTKFDLDRVGSTRHGAAAYSVVAQRVGDEDIDFNENDLADVDIMCYYAYSGLFEESDADVRTELLGDVCTEAQIAEITFTFDDDLQGWSPGTSGKELDSVEHVDANGGAVKLDGSDFGEPDGEPNSWIFRTIDLPLTVSTLRFETSADNNAETDAELRVRLVDEIGESHTLLNWQVLTGQEGSLRFVERQVDIAEFAGQAVTIYFEQGDNDVGIGELVYVDAITIR